MLSGATTLAVMTAMMTESRIRPRALSLLLAVAFALGLAVPVLAEHEAPRLGLTPIGQDGQFFDVTLRPGQSAELQVEVASFGHDDVLARTYAADVYSIINGGFGAELFGDPPSGATHWLDYPAREVVLEPSEAVVINFGVTVPFGTPPGEYIAALVTENTDPYRGDPGSIVLEQVNRVALAVAIDVPGPRGPSIEIGAVGHKSADATSFVTFEVANTGNVHLKPSGEFILRDAAGTELAASPALMDSVYAGSRTLFETPLAEALEPGAYCAELSLTDETGAADSTECLMFRVAPPPDDAVGDGQGSQEIPIVRPAINAVVDYPLPVALIAIAVLALLGGIWLMWRRRRNSRASEPG